MGTRKSVRMLRIRTLRRAGNGAQPELIPTDPDVEPTPRKTHYCAECFRPRSMHTNGPFCFRCAGELFGSPDYGYAWFIRSEAARQVQARVRANRAAGLPPGQPGSYAYRVHFWDGTLFYGRHKYPCGKVGGIVDPADGMPRRGSGFSETTDRELVTCVRCRATMT